MSQKFERLILLREKLEFQELTEYVEAFRNLWTIEHQQLSRHSDAWWCRYATDGQAVLYEEQYGARLVIRGVPSGDFLIFALPCRPELGGSWLGETIPAHGLGWARSGMEVGLLLAHGSRTLCAMLPAPKFRADFEKLAGRPVERCFPQGRVFRQLSADDWNRLRRKWLHFLSQSSGSIDLCAELTASLAALANPEIVPSRPVKARTTFNRAMELVTHGDEVPRPSVIALELGISLRTLEGAFRACVDLPPARYLRHCRLNGAHLQLAAADPKMTNVTTIALDHGFTELGRFAGDYRRIFGVSPSETLQRAARPRFPRVASV